MNQADDYMQGMQRKVGWFVLLGLGMLLLMLFIAGVRSNFFAQKFYVFIQPPTAIAFFEGQPVRFQGFSIGYVDMIELLEHGKVQITLQLLDRYRSMLHEGAVVQLAKEGLIGEQFLRITAGDLAAPIIQNKLLLNYESEASIEQILEDIKPTIAQADRLLSELGNLAVWLNDPAGDVRLAISNFRDFSSGLRGEDMQKMTREMFGLLKHTRLVMAEIESEHMMANVSHALGSTAVALDELKPFMHELGQQGGDSLEKLNILLERIALLSENLNVISSDMTELTPELPGLTRELRESVSESRLLMRRLRQSWLLGGGNEDLDEQQGVYRAPPAVGFRP